MGGAGPRGIDRVDRVARRPPPGCDPAADPGRSTRAVAPRPVLVRAAGRADPGRAGARLADGGHEASVLPIWTRPGSTRRAAEHTGLPWRQAHPGHPVGCRVLFPTATFAIFFLLVLPLSWLRCRGRTAGGRSSSSRATSSTAGGTGTSSSCSPAATVWNHAARRPRSTGRRVAVAARSSCSSLALAGNVGVLGYFKYYDFFVNSTRQPASDRRARRCRSALRTIVLPVGISFYTFMAISYVVDTYRGDFVPVDAREVRRLPLVLPASRRRSDRAAGRADPAVRDAARPAARSTRAAPST